MEKGEDFLIQLNSFPKAKLKIQIWNFTFEYLENYECVFNPVRAIKLAIEEIKTNEIFKKILGYVLTIGNIMNGNTSKGQADGFNLDFLNKLNGVKDNANKNVLQYILGEIKKQDETFENFKKNFPNVGEAGKIPLAETQSGLNRLKKDVKEAQNMFNKISTLKDEFCNKMSVIVEQYTKQVEDVEKELEANIKLFQETVLYYGYEAKESKYKNPEEFFVLIDGFLSDIDKFTPKTEIKKTFKGTNEVGKKVVENTNKMDSILKELKNKTVN